MILLSSTTKNRKNSQPPPPNLYIEVTNTPHKQPIATPEVAIAINYVTKESSPGLDGIHAACSKIYTL